MTSAFKQKLILFSLLNLMVVGLIAAVMVVGVKLQKNITRQQTELAGLQADLAALDQLLADRQTYQQDISTILASLPATYQEVAGFTLTLEELTAETDLVLDTTIDREPKTEPAGLTSLKYTITTDGPLDNYGQFLAYLSRLPYHTKIDAIKTDVAKNAGNTLTTYRLYLFQPGDQANSAVPSLNTQKIDNISRIISQTRQTGGENK